MSALGEGGALRGNPLRHAERTHHPYAMKAQAMHPRFARPALQQIRSGRTYRWLRQRPMFTLFALVALWMLSGLFSSPDDTNQRTEQTSDAFLVQADTSRAQTIDTQVIAYGKTEPERQVSLQAEVDGTVKQLLTQEGQRVKAGDAIVALNVEDRAASLAEAQALLTQKRTEYTAAAALYKKGYTAKTTRTAREAELNAARAQLERARLNVEKLAITAPFDGRIEQLDVEKGSRLQKQQTAVALIVDMDPLIVRLNVSEFEVNAIHTGMPADVTLMDGQTYQGTVRFVGSVGAEDIQTFRVEIAIPNPDYTLQAGLSTEVRIITGQTQAHFLSPSVLVLDDDGNVGVHVLDDTHTAHFTPIRIVRDAQDGMWLAGLPEQATIATRGTAFIHDGQKVRVKQISSSPAETKETQQVAP